MAMWKKALVVGLVVLVGAFPVLARVDLGLPSTPNVPQQASTPLPEGKELGDEELIQAEGEFWHFIVVGIILGLVKGAYQTIHENWFDEERGIDKDDRAEIYKGMIEAAVMGAAGAGLGKVFIRG